MIENFDKFCFFFFKIFKSRFLLSMCSEPFPVSKAVQPGSILSLISRGLAVNCTTLSKNLITDNVAIGALLPQIHVALFRLLDTLILLYVPYAFCCSK